MKNILVTGAKGMFGSDFIAILKERGYNYIATDIEELDITDENQVADFFNQNNNITDVVHAAAYTQVDQAENDKEKAFIINATGTENLAKITGKLGIPMLYISTDYVFDGTKNTPYEPDDQTNPLGVYGASKLKGEEALQQYNSKYYIARTSWLYGHYGKNFIETMIKLSKDRDELKVVNDQFGSPTWTVELANAILKILEEKQPYGIYHVCGSGFTTWYGFACKIFELMNINIKVNPCTSSEFQQLAKRPKYSVMDNRAICPFWQDSLTKYIELRERILV